ncbi:MAG: toll/interleukin-1 receptor domain-containing protein [Anaerolineae bacterium]|jgi:hypothetical protein|nr:toll/interleukin-1 receptor domain-containing protein [Anaerolineae bacterium]
MTTVENLRFRTIEQKRAVVYRALRMNPHDQRMWSLMLKLSSPQQIYYASKQGVFINYSRTDDLFVTQLVTDLREARIDVWLDMLDVSYQGDWRKEIGHALDRCGVMLMISSRAALQDGDLFSERQYFLTCGKIIVPIMYQAESIDLIGYPPPVDFRYSYGLGLQHLKRMLAPRPATREMR